MKLKFWLFGLLLLTCIQAFAQVTDIHGELNFVPARLIIRPLQDEIQAFKGNDQQHVIYELMISNVSTTPIRLRSLQIQGKKCHSHSSKDCKISYHFVVDSQGLPAIFSPANEDPLFPHDPLLQPNQNGFLYLMLDFASLKDVPDIIQNFLEVEVEETPIRVETLSSDPIRIKKSRPIVISPPLKGKNWLAYGGPSNTSYHRRSILIINGNTQLSERFAIDFIKYGSAGLFNGNELSNQSYYSYGQKILAVGDGTVIRTLDNIQENIPGIYPSPTTVDNAGGNFVILKLDSNHYAFYAHMIPGSIRVKKGDRVQTGQVIGLLGNSGNSNAPHLHFQISDRPFAIYPETQPNALNAQGIPWVINRFLREDYLPLTTNNYLQLFQEIQILNSHKVKKQIPMENQLVSFPD